MEVILNSAMTEGLCLIMKVNNILYFQDFSSVLLSVFPC